MGPWQWKEVKFLVYKSGDKGCLKKGRELNLDGGCRRVGKSWGWEKGVKVNSQKRSKGRG